MISLCYSFDLPAIPGRKIILTFKSDIVVTEMVIPDEYE
jgi:hypothetical protein